MKRSFILIIFTAFIRLPCAAQWHISAPVDNGIVFGVQDTFLFESVLNVSTGNYQVLRHTLSQPLVPWTEADGGIDFTQGFVGTFASLGKCFFAGLARTSGENAPAYGSTNNGSTWYSLQSAGPIATNGTYLFGTDITPEMRRSRDTGKTWEVFTNLDVQSFGCNGACIFAGTSTTLWRSLDSGSVNTWAMDTTPISNIKAFTFLGSIAYALNGSGSVIESTDSGTSWTQISIPHRTITALAASGKYLFAGTDSGVFLSLDFGSNWLAEDSGLGGFLKVSALGVFDTLLFVSANNGAGNIGWCIGNRPIVQMVDTAKSIVQMIPPGDTIVVYPNPAMGTVTILAGGTSIFAVSVLNVLGEDVLDVPNVRESEITLDLSKIPSGTYFLQIQTSSGMQLRKIAIEK
jgi:Secretion system C-terminal sorting domain